MSTVKITNITDYPGRTKTILEIYGVSILPGDSTSIATDLLDDKIFAHEYEGQLAINTPPDYYENFKKPRQATKQDIINKLRKVDLKSEEKIEDRSEDRSEDLSNKSSNKKKVR